AVAGATIARAGGDYGVVATDAVVAWNTDGHEVTYCSTIVLQYIFAWSRAMSTTTIRLPQELKARVARAAKRAGTTAHSFILEAIAEKADQAERRVDFHDVAE